MGFVFTQVRQGLLHSALDSMYPTQMLGHSGEGETVIGELTDTVFGVVTQGKIEIECAGVPRITLCTGMFFSIPATIRIQGSGSAVLFLRKGFKGMLSFGGPVEERGRLTYIDGCRSSVLAGPPRLGDPCLNLLTFPVNTKQTQHLHPTLRYGVVLRGSGVCCVPGDEPIALAPGIAFFLDESHWHFFQSKEAMVIVTYHPDSDVGPTDEMNPMRSRTYLDR